MEAHVGNYSNIIKIRLGSVVDPDSLNPDPDPAFQVNPDPGF
jgi:hypothetical protein